MMKQYFDDLVSGIEGAIAADPENASPRKIYTLEVARIGQRLYGGEERVAWCGITVPFDLLAAMGVTSCFVEFVGAMLASTGMVDAFLEEAEQVGFGGDTCAYHRSVLPQGIYARAGFFDCRDLPLQRRRGRHGTAGPPFRKGSVCSQCSPGDDGRQRAVPGRPD